MHTRTVVSHRHALIAPDGHVPSAFPGWEKATGFVILSPAMGASLSQILVTFEGNEGRAGFDGDEMEHALYVETGSCRVEIEGGEKIELETTGFAFVPAGLGVSLVGSKDARVTVFRKEFENMDGIGFPPVTFGHASEVEGEPFMGNERAMLKTLLPIDPRFDLAINIFTYEPGATLPFVETHIMEHGLLMLSGQGVYRMEEQYYPVEAGDAIWMAPYCPQWFAAIGDVPASYLYYKDIHRLP